MLSSRRRARRKSPLIASRKAQCKAGGEYHRRAAFWSWKKIRNSCIVFRARMPYYFRMPDLVLSLDDYSFQVVIEGDGPPVVFVHGSVADLSTFSGISNRLSGAFRCISYSRRFHPPNAPPEPGEIYDTARHADDLLEIATRLSHGPVAVVGSSFGGYVALIAAMRAPERFRALVLCEPPMIPLLLHHPTGKALHDQFLHEVIEPARSLFRQGMDLEGLKTFVEGVRGQPGWFDRLFPPLRRDLLRFGPELRAEFLTGDTTYMPEISPDALRDLRVPTLLLGGALSKPMFGAILDVLESSITNAKRTTLRHAGHLVHLQNPAAFESTLRDFLRRY